MNLLRRCIDPGHRLSQLRIDLIFNRHRAEIRIFAVKASFSRLIGMLEPVIANHGRLPQGCSDVAFEALGALDLARHPRSAAACIGQAGIVTAEGKFGNQARFPACRISIDNCTWVEVVTIERDHIEVAAGGGNHIWMRLIAEPGADHEMIGVGSLDGRDAQLEILFGDNRDKGIAIREKCRARGIGEVGFGLKRVVQTTGWHSEERRLDMSDVAEFLP